MKQSAGLLLYRKTKKGVEVLLVHPGGPFWAKKDKGAWSIPKGEFTGEDPFAAAKREFSEETGMTAPVGGYVGLGEVKQASGKVVYVWAAEGDFDPTQLKSNTFELEWPPKSGKTAAYPEADKAAWYALPQAASKILKGQLPFIGRLVTELGVATDLADPSEDTTQTALF